MDVLRNRFRYGMVIISATVQHVYQKIAIFATTCGKTWRHYKLPMTMECAHIYMKVAFSSYTRYMPQEEESKLRMDGKTSRVLASNSPISHHIKMSQWLK